MTRHRTTLLVILLAVGGVEAGTARGQAPDVAAPAARKARRADPGMWDASGQNGAVVAGGAAAVEAGLETLKAEGNAAAY